MQRSMHGSRRSPFTYPLRIYANAGPPISIFYAEMVMLSVERQRLTRSWNMLSFMASQAIALSQVKQEANTAPAATGQPRAAQSTRKGFWSRLFEAMVDSRMRRAEIELRYHRGLHEESSSK
jgi:hypothetical protein